MWHWCQLAIDMDDGRICDDRFRYVEKMIRKCGDERFALNRPRPTGKLQRDRVSEATEVGGSPWLFEVAYHFGGGPCELDHMQKDWRQR